MRPDSPSPPLADSSLAAALVADGPVEDVDAFLTAMQRRDGEVEWFGVAADPRPDRPGDDHYFAVGTDSTVWIQAPGARMIAADAFPIWAIGDEIGTRLSMSEVEQSVAHAGYGYEDGRLYLYLTQSAPVYAVGGLALLVVLGLAVVVQRLRAGLRRAETRNQLLVESRRRLADSREAERMRLARDLHDGPLQDLQAARMRVGMAARNAAGQVSAADARLAEDIQQDLIRVASDLRSISGGLRPPVLDSFGLAAALRALADQARAAYPDIDIHVRLPGSEDDLPEGVGITLYRITQEALSNAARHGAPSRIDISFERDDAGARLRVEDDGKGFEVPSDPLVLEQTGHLGVTGMIERAESFGGHLHLDSRPGRTRLRAYLPLTP